MSPVLKVLHVLVAYDSRSRQIVLGPPALLGNLQSQSSDCYFGDLNPKLVPSPLWPKPGTCLAVPDSSLDRLGAEKCLLKRCMGKF